MALPARLSSTWRSRAASPITSHRQPLVDIGRDLELSGLRPRRQQFGDVLDQCRPARTGGVRGRSCRLRSWNNPAAPRSATAARRRRSSPPWRRSICSGVSGVSSSSPLMPMMPLSGVRISWDAIARKRDLARLAASAWSRASASARSVSVRSVTSRPTLCISAGWPASVRTRPSRQAIQRGPSAVCDLLVVDPRAVRLQRGVALLEHVEREAAADQRARAVAAPVRNRRR